MTKQTVILTTDPRTGQASAPRIHTGHMTQQAMRAYLAGLDDPSRVGFVLFWHMVVGSDVGDATGGWGWRHDTDSGWRRHALT